MKPIRTLVTLALLAGAALPALAQQVVGIASDQQGSLGYNTGVAVAKVLNTEAGIIARTQPMAGTAAYLPLINRGEMEFGFCNPVEADFSFSGTGNFAGNPNPNLRVVGAMFPLATGLMVVADSGIRTIADVKAKAKDMRIAAEYTASTTIKYYIAGALANGGMTYDDFIKVPVSSFVKGMEALGDDKVDLTLISLGSGAGRKVDTKLKSRGGIRYVSLDNSPEGIARFKKFLPAGNIVTMKANPSMPGLDQDANIVQIPWMMVTHKDASEELVYQVTKAIAENHAALGEAFGAFKRAKVEAMAPALSMPYHPGALRYYKEAGIPTL
jgi:hypothetical protein